jgi:hypothetical protein
MVSQSRRPQSEDSFLRAAAMTYNEKHYLEPDTKKVSRNELNVKQPSINLLKRTLFYM